MAVTVDIPGIGPIIASNAAENSTLQALLEATNRVAQRLGAQRVELSNFQRAADAATGEIGGLGAAAAGAASSTERLAVKQQQAIVGFQRSLRSAGASFKGIFSSGGDFASGIEKGMSTLGKLGDVAGGAITAGLTARFGGAGLAAGKALQYLGAAAGGVAGLFVGEITKMVRGFEDLINSGGSFGYSMNAFADAAAESGLSAAQFGRVMKEAAPSLAIFGGNTREGGRQLVRFMGNLRGENIALSKSMRLMGVAYDAQGIMLADYTANLAKSGVAISNVNTDDVVKGFFELTKQQRQFAQYNGITLDQQRELQKQARENVSVEAVIQSQGLIGKAAEEFRAKYAQITQQYGDSAGQLFLQQKEFGGAVTETAAAVEMMNPQLANMTKAAGATGADLATMQRTMLDPETQRNAMREMGQLAVLGVAGVNDSLVTSAGEMMMKLRDDLPKQIGDVMTKIATDMGKMIQDVATNTTANIGSMSDMFVRTTSAVQDFRNALTSATAYVMDSGAFQGAIGTIVDGTEWLANLLAGRKKLEIPQSLYNENYIQQQAEQASKPPSPTNPQAAYLQGWGEEVKNHLKDIKDNQTKGFRLTPRPTTGEQIKREFETNPYLKGYGKPDDSDKMLRPEDRSKTFPISPQPRLDSNTIGNLSQILNQNQIDGFEEAGKDRITPQFAKMMDEFNQKQRAADEKQKELIAATNKTGESINQSNQQMANLSNILREGLRSMNSTLEGIETNTA